MIYLLGRSSTFTIFYDFKAIPEYLRSEVIEVDSLPEGEGILRKAEDGEFYYEPFPIVEDLPIIDPEPEPLPTETLEEKVTRLESTIEQNNLMSMDVSLSVFEEILALREEVAALKGTTINA